MGTDLTPEAVEAARQAVGRCLGLTHSPAELISLALVAAAPHIAAAERARIVSLLTAMDPADLARRYGLHEGAGAAPVLAALAAEIEGTP